MAGARVISPDLVADLLLVTEKGQTMRMDIADVKTSGRSTQGVILMRPGEGNKISSISLIIESHGEDEEEAEETEKKPTIKKKGK